MDPNDSENKSNIGKSSADSGKDSEEKPKLNKVLESQLDSLLGGIKEASGQAIKFTSEKTLGQAEKLIRQTPENLQRMVKAGDSLKNLRETAGLTINELAETIDLENPDLLEAVEDGKTALSFEILLRLASFYARNDPIPFILRYAKTYNPMIAGLLKTLGLDRLVLEAEREVLFLNIYRSRDLGRRLSDEDFERVRAFTEQAFSMALDFSAERENLLPPSIPDEDS